MYKKSRTSTFLLTAFFLLISLTLPLSAFAEGSNLSIRLWGQVSPIISGDAGNNSGSPNYDDAFKTGVGGGVELSWRFCRWFSCVGGTGYEVYDGDNYQGLSFSDLEIVPVYVGGKFHLIPDNSPWDFYLRMDLGAVHLSSVDISFMSLLLITVKYFIGLFVSFVILISAKTPLLISPKTHNSSAFLTKLLLAPLILSLSIVSNTKYSKSIKGFKGTQSLSKTNLEIYIRK